MIFMDECAGCVRDNSIDIREHLEFCHHCKRAYYDPFERSIHGDLYVNLHEKEEKDGSNS